jgi:hypothetical protein
MKKVIVAKKEIAPKKAEPKKVAIKEKKEEVKKPSGRFEKVLKADLVDGVTEIFICFRRMDLIKQTVEAFVESNTHPVEEIIIVNDSCDKEIHKQLKEMFPKYHLIFGDKNEGQMKSIDRAYAEVKTKYVYLSIDDWCCNGEKGFIEKALVVLKNDPMIEEVWFADYNGHPLQPDIIGKTRSEYRIVDNWLLGEKTWHGFTTACALKRVEDYKLVAPFNKYYKSGLNIWEKEWTLGEEYYKLGYRSACLVDVYVKNTGAGRSEYVSNDQE